VIFSYGIAFLQSALGSRLSVAFRVFLFTIPFTLLRPALRFGEQVRVLGDEFVVVSGGVSDDRAIRETELVSVVVVLSLPFLRSVFALSIR